MAQRFEVRPGEFPAIHHGNVAFVTGVAAPAAVRTREAFTAGTRLHRLSSRAVYGVQNSPCVSSVTSTFRNTTDIGGLQEG